MAAVGRRRLGLRKPPVDISDFPVRPLRRGKVVFRAHHVKNGPWWFANGDGGRFDLDAPSGTCYLAADEETALRERLGPDMVRLGTVSQQWADETVVSRLRIQRGGRLADTCHRDVVKFGLTREVATYTGKNYSLTRQWARKFYALQLRGVLYESRFTTVSEPNAFAIFGNAGAKPGWPVDPNPRPGQDACHRAGLKILSPPPMNALQIIR